MQEVAVGMCPAVAARAKASREEGGCWVAGVAVEAAEAERQAALMTV